MHNKLLEIYLSITCQFDGRFILHIYIYSTVTGIQYLANTEDFDIFLGVRLLELSSRLPFILGVFYAHDFVKIYKESNTGIERGN